MQLSKFLAIIACLNSIVIQTATANTGSPSSNTPAGYTRFEDFLNNKTIGDLPPFSESRRIEIPEEARSYLGGRTEISWEAGDRPADRIPFGAFNTGFGAGKLSTDDIGTKRGLSKEQIRDMPLSAGGFTGITPKELIAGTPNLANLQISQSPKLASAMGLSPSGGRGGGGTFGQAIAGGRGGSAYNNAPLTKAQLDGISFGDIPGLAETQLRNFPTVLGQAPSEIFGVVELRISQIITLTIPPTSLFGKINFSAVREGPFADRVVSGGSGQPNAPCQVARGCNYVEFVSAMRLNEPVNGARIISGDTQKVTGGWGHDPLIPIHNKQEPTGFFPFGTGEVPKFVFEKIDPRTGKFDLNMYLAIGIYAPFVGKVGQTPHFVGPIPLMPGLHEKSGMIFPLGVASVPLPAPKAIPSLPSPALPSVVPSSTPSPSAIPSVVPSSIPSTPSTPSNDIWIANAIGNGLLPTANPYIPSIDSYAQTF